MSPSEVQAVLSRIEQQLAGVGELDSVVAESVEELLNVVESLSSDKQSLLEEVQRLKAQFQQKKKAKTTDQGDGPKSNSDHSSEKHRRKRRDKKSTSAQDGRSFKDLPIHETIECPVDPEQLPSDAVRVENEAVRSSMRASARHRISRLTIRRHASMVSSGTRTFFATRFMQPTSLGRTKTA